MGHNFEPLQNDLIIRAAWGQVVERPPIWIMRQAGRYLPEYHEAKGKRDFFECCRDPEESKKMLQKIAELCVEYLALQVQAGAQLVQVFDSWAGELSPASFEKFSAPYLSYISANLPRRLKELGLDPVPMIVFPKGAWYALESACDMGYNVVGLDWTFRPSAANKARGDRSIVLQGNADPGVLYGTKEAITAAVEEMVEGFGWAAKKKGWIVNLGHGITPLVNPDDLKFYLQEIHRQTQN
ncbi:hypothetical protein RB593_002156 [Gaeumannomyces tritici]